MAEYVDDSVGVSKKRVYWGAIFAGMVVTLVTGLALGTLGVAFGAGSIDALTEANPLQGLGIGTGIWLLALSLLSLFAGGWVAGRLAGVKNRVDSMLHGTVNWGLATLASFFLLTSLVGGILSGTANAVGRVAGVVGQGVGAIAPEVANVVGDRLGLDQVDLTSIKNEATQILSQTKKPELQPKHLERDAKGVMSSAGESAKDVAKNPQTADAEFHGLLDRAFAQGKDAVDAVDKEAIVNVLVARTDMSREEARRTVDNWEATVKQAKQRIGEVANQAENKARQAADVTAEKVSQAAVWSFIGMILGFLASSAGGWLGGPKGIAPTRYRSRMDDERIAA